MIVDDILAQVAADLTKEWPVLAVVGVVAWQLQRDLRSCIAHTTEMLDKFASYVMRDE